MGYQQAGFEVVGVDLEPQRRYPFTFHQGDALKYVAKHWRDFDAIHASPPCQAYSVTRHGHTVEHPALVPETREALQATGLPWVIENVPGAPLRDPLTLCGTEFGLTAYDPASDLQVALRRHRLFESTVFLWGAGGCLHNPASTVAGVYGGARSDLEYARNVRRGGYTPAKPVAEALLGIDWMTLHGLHQALPPVYTRFIGEQLIAAL